MYILSPVGDHQCMPDVVKNKTVNMYKLTLARDSQCVAGGVNNTTPSICTYFHL